MFGDFNAEMGDINFSPKWLRVFAIALFLIKLSAGQAIVKTIYGPIYGDRLRIDTGDVNRFRGIPYAKPPIGDLRFKPPEEPIQWNATIQMHKYSDMCVQLDGEMAVGSEDCLYLNVFAPRGGNKLAVMVWIHGGTSGLMSGDASLYPGETLASVGNVIVVTFNYRLGIFGFFTDGGKYYMGNAGFYDQIMVLEWVQKNIERFGGDPDNVTLFGGNGGSYSVNVHMVSPKSKGLFRRAISQSGTIRGAYLDTDSQRALQNNLFGSVIGCRGLEGDELVTCITNVTAEELYIAVRVFPEYFRHYVFTIGNDILPVHPDYYWERKEVNAKEYILGLNADDGDSVLWRFGPLRVRQYLLEGILSDSNDFITTVNNSLLLFNEGQPETNSKVWNAVLSQYLPDQFDPYSNTRGLLNMARDICFLLGTISCASLMTQKSNTKTYMYYFDGNFPIDESFEYDGLFNLHSAPEVNVRAGHMTEIPYIFGWTTDSEANMYSPYIGKGFNFTEDQRNLGLAMVTAWTSFAKTGKPLFNTTTSHGNTWPRYGDSEKLYLHFTPDVSRYSIKSRLLPQALNFWNDLLPAYKIVQNMTGIVAQVPVETPKPTPGEPIVAASCIEDNPSTMSRTNVETALFILIMLFIVILLVLLVLLMEYCALKQKKTDFVGMPDNGSTK